MASRIFISISLVTVFLSSVMKARNLAGEKLDLKLFYFKDIKIFKMIIIIRYIKIFSRYFNI